MEKRHNSTDKFERALEYRRGGYRLVILRPGSKVPAFRGWQSKHFGDEALKRLLSEADWNIGIMTGGELVVLDIDSQHPAKVAWAIEHCGDTPMRCRTPRGGLHLYYRADRGVEYGNAVRIGGEPYDLRWKGCFVTCPWSRTPTGVVYQWAGPILPARELPRIDVSALLTRTSTKAIAPPPTASPALDRPASGIHDIAAYIRRIPSIQGQNGSKALVRVCMLLLEHGCDMPRALTLLADWNADRAAPPWSDSDLNRALANAFNRKLKRPGDGRQPLLSTSEGETR